MPVTLIFFYFKHIFKPITHTNFLGPKVRKTRIMLVWPLAKSMFQVLLLSAYLSEKYDKSQSEYMTMNNFIPSKFYLMYRGLFEHRS